MVTFYIFNPKYVLQFQKTSVHNQGIGIKGRAMAIENRIYREEFTRKKCKTAILLYCFHTAGVLHIFMLKNLLGPGISFYRKSKINVKIKPNYEIGWPQVS